MKEGVRLCKPAPSSRFDRLKSIYLHMKENHSIIFVCHGNICRSPMAEYIMKSLVDREGRT